MSEGGNEDFVFFGSSRHSVDDKSRVAVPKHYRKVLPAESNGRFILNVSRDRTIEIHPVTSWRRKSMAPLAVLQTLVDDERRLLRQELSRVSEVEMDSSYRILIPRPLLEEANLVPGAECIMNGMGRYFEICSLKNWAELLAQDPRSKNREKPGVPQEGGVKEGTDKTTPGPAAN